MTQDELLIELNRVQGEINKIQGHLIASIIPESGNQVYFDELDNETRDGLRRASKVCYKAFLRIYEHI